MQRRLFTSLLAASALLGPLQITWAAGAPPLLSESDVKVERQGKGFTVDFTFYAPVTPTQAWAVLTDFEHMHDFLPNLATSQVSDKTATELKVSQTGTAHFGVFSTHFESVRQITLAPPHEIRSHGVGGNLKQSESLMELHAEGSGTRLTYHAEVVPDFWFPPGIGPSLVRQDTAEQFSAMLQEMIRRL